MREREREREKERLPLKRETQGQERTQYLNWMHIAVRAPKVTKKISR